MKSSAALARPIVVERLLRARFENDDALHAAPRREAEQAREAALAAGQGSLEKQRAALSASGTREVTETTW